MKAFSIILSSGSRYRAELLRRLGLAFQAWAPEIDESPRPGESCAGTARRLAREKAEAARLRHPGALVIGSDQVAEHDGQAVGKPGNRENARRQLCAMRGKTVIFHTALCVLAGDRVHEAIVPTEVVVRSASDAEIERYLDLEPAFDCAGSAKSEGLGISLLAAMRGEDPTALVGLPLIALSAMLRTEGVAVP